MDWIFDNLGKLAPVAIFLFYLLSAIKGGKKEEQEDPEAAERSRKIQEEIRRKIMERMKGNEPSNASEAESYVEEETPYRQYEEEPPAYDPFLPESEQRRPVRPAPSYVEPVHEVEWEEQETVVETVQEDDPFERQRRSIEEQLKKAADLKRIADEKAKSVEGKVSRHPLVSASTLGNRVKLDLQERQALRRSVILKELLDKPVGLR